MAIRGNSGYFGNDKWEGVALDQDAFTLGEMLKAQGYQTAFIGKWHLDHPDDVNTWASGHGFDYAAQEQWPARFNPIRPFPPNRLWVNGDQEYIPYDYKKYSCKDELRTDLAFDFLENREKENPFFLFMSYRSPHSFEGPIRDTLFYADQDWPDIEKAHAAKITLLDRQIGRLLRQLKKIGVLEIHWLYSRVITDLIFRLGVTTMSFLIVMALCEEGSVIYMTGVSACLCWYRGRGT